MRVNSTWVPKVPPPALALGNELLVKQLVGNTWAVRAEYESPLKTLSLHGKPFGDGRHLSGPCLLWGGPPNYIRGQHGKGGLVTCRVHMSASSLHAWAGGGRRLAQLTLDSGGGEL